MNECPQYHRGLYFQLRGKPRLVFIDLSLTSPSQYRRIEGTDVVVPIMSLGEDMKKLSLGDGGCSKGSMVHASAAGSLPTFKDVKKSLKVRC
jgi:hypothetical protein